jgi:hypothetical protein
MPLQIDQLGSSKPVAIGHEDHGGIAVPIAASFARGVDQPLIAEIAQKK